MTARRTFLGFLLGLIGLGGAAVTASPSGPIRRKGWLAMPEDEYEALLADALAHRRLKEALAYDPIQIQPWQPPPLEVAGFYRCEEASFPLADGEAIDFVPVTVVADTLGGIARHIEGVAGRLVAYRTECGEGPEVGLFHVFSEPTYEDGVGLKATVGLTVVPQAKLPPEWLAGRTPCPPAARVVVASVWPVGKDK